MTKPITIYFDSDITIHRFQYAPKWREDFLATDYDLWNELQFIKSIIPIAISFDWVRSHQDTGTRTRVLSKASQMNIQVDALATKTREALSCSCPTIQLPRGEIYICLSRKRLHHFPTKEIRHHIHGPPLLDYIRTKTGWSSLQCHSIDWDLLRSVLKKLSPPQVINWVKLQHNWQHTRHQYRLFQPTSNSSCPMACGANETPLHFCQCQAPIAILSRIHHLQHLDRDMRRSRTCPSLRRAILTLISDYCDLPVTDPFLPSQSSRSTAIVRAIILQRELGVSNLLKGRIPTDLLLLQLPHFQLHSSAQSCPNIRWKAWKKTFLSSIVDFTLRLWGDRNSMFHGTALSFRSHDLSCHVHQCVTSEYKNFASNPDPTIAFPFQTPLHDRLKASLSSLRLWLQQVRDLRERQTLLLTADAIITDLLAENVSVDCEKIHCLSTEALRKWINSKHK